MGTGNVDYLGQLKEKDYPSLQQWVRLIQKAVQTIEWLADSKACLMIIEMLELLTLKDAATDG